MARDAEAASLRQFAGELGVDPDLAEAVGGQESGYDPAAVSPKGAKGTMQVMDGTSSDMEPKYGPDRRRQGVGYLKDQLDSFPDIEDDDTRKKFALAAYNAGPGRVEKVRAHLRKRGLDDRNFDLVSRFLPPETRNYVPGVLGRVAKGASTSVIGGAGVASVQANPYSPEALLAGAQDHQKYSPDALLAGATEPSDAAIEEPAEPAPTFMGEMGKEGERVAESARSIGRHLAAPFTQPSTGSFGGDFKEGVKHGVAAAWEALGLVSPGSIPDAALTAGGHPIAGKVARIATDVALPFAGKGSAIKDAEGAAAAVKGAVSGAERTAVEGARAGYAARDAAADAAGLKVRGDHPAIEALKQEAATMLRKHGSKAREWVDRIMGLGEEEAPAVAAQPPSRILTASGQHASPGHPALPAGKVAIDVPHSDIRDIESGLTDAAKRDPWLGHLRDEVGKTRSTIEKGDATVAKQSDAMAKDYPRVAKLRKLRRQVVNPGTAPSTEKTATEALRALNDPQRLKAAVDTMDPKTAQAFKLFHRRAKMAAEIAGKTGGKTANALLALEGGRLIYHGTQGKLDLGEAGGAALALALRNPKVAMVVAKGLTTARTGAAAAVLARRLADSGVLDGVLPQQEE